MTLVLTVVTRTAVYQASDRRVVHLDTDGTLRRCDDETNKAVVWCRRIAFAYTGFAELGAEGRTDLWLSNVLASIEMSSVPGELVDQAWLLEQLAEQATDYLARSPWSNVPPEDRQHAFVGVGWARFGGVDPFRPYRVLVSNFHDEDLRELVEARDRFHAYARALAPGEGGCLEAIPSRLPGDAVQRLIAQVANADDPPTDPRLVVALLVEEIRRVADDDPEVGRGVLVSVIPRLAVERDLGFLIASEYEPDSPTFLYVPPGASTGEIYGPVATCGGAQMANFIAGPLRD